MFSKFSLYAMSYILFGLVLTLINLVSGFKDMAENPLPVSGNANEAVQIDPESLDKLIDALNQVDKSSSASLRHLNSIFENAQSVEAEDKKSFLENVSEEVGNTVAEIVSIETHLDLFVVTALLSVILYILFIAINGLWDQICDTRSGMPIIRVMLYHPYLLVIGTYIAVLLYFTEG